MLEDFYVGSRPSRPDPYRTFLTKLILDPSHLDYYSYHVCFDVDVFFFVDGVMDQKSKLTVVRSQVKFESCIEYTGEFGTSLQPATAVEVIADSYTIYWSKNYAG